MTRALVALPTADNQITRPGHPEDGWQKQPGGPGRVRGWEGGDTRSVAEHSERPPLT